VQSGGAQRRQDGQFKQGEPRRPLAFVAAEGLFARAERQIALLARVRPQNLGAECAAWAAALRRGTHGRPAWRYAPAGELGGLRRELASAIRSLAGLGALGQLYERRAEELELEAMLAEQVDTPSFGRTARLRHPVRRGPEHDRANELAAAWATLCVAASPGACPTSDDRRHPDSLINLLAREIAQLGVPIRVVVQREMQSKAACGDGVVFVRAGLPLLPSEARRIVAHELHGHALPRVLARSHPFGLLRVGSAGANDDEEGRALHIEEHLGLLHDGRRRELGWRHLAGLWVATGADGHECIERLRQFGCGIEDAIALYARVQRGGGLCRELEYIPAWLRFARALHEDAPLAAWLARGRVSLAAARVLRSEGVPPGDDRATILDLSVASDRATG